MHGGIHPRIHSLEQLRNLRRPTLDFDNKQPTLELDLLWADPDDGIRGIVPNPRYEFPHPMALILAKFSRGASVLFGEDVVAYICRQLDIDMIVRAHQVQFLFAFLE